MTTNTQTKASAKPPIAKIRAGMLSASIWERSTDKGTFHSVSLDRHYKDAAGKWQTTHSFDFINLLALSKLADLAHTKITQLRADETE